MARLDKVGGAWVNLEKPGGAVFFVGGGTVANGGIGASDGNSGLDPKQPLATIDGTAGAHNKVVAGRGDTIVILPGSVTITAAIALDVADVTLTGIDPNNTINPSAILSSLAASADAINVTAANVVIENLHFPASTAATTSRIDAGAERLTVRNCTFSGDNNTNKWDAGAINSGVAHTGCLIDNNIFWEGLAVEFTTTATGIISRNFAGEGATLGQAFDPGSCMCFENYEADAVDETGRIFPTSAAS
jgi:hypothetical protein